MPGESTILWHDYETTGARERRDRPMQFASVRTGLDLEPIGDPVVLHCRLADDFLPDPEACLLTGLTPARIEASALPEVAFMQRVLAELDPPGTCSAGFNSIRFDDEITRFALWRSLLPVYAREWQNGNSRWDLIDPLRAAYALRPSGIEWPRRPTGEPSFRLEDLAAANGIPHVAHEALADVQATIALARLLRRAQPKLYGFLFENRSRQRVSALLRLGSGEPVVHVSKMIGAAQACTTLVLPICRHPRKPDTSVIVVDLRHDPTPLLELPASEIARLLFTPRTALEDEAPRIGVKEIHLNRCPVVAPATVLDDATAERIGLDRAACARRAAVLRDATRVKDRLQEIYGAELPDDGRELDPDFALYGGGFVSDRDASVLARVHRLAPHQLAGLEHELQDWRLAELLFRFRARNHGDTLTVEEKRRWDEHCRGQLFGHVDDEPSRAAYVKQRIAALRAERSDEAQALEILSELDAYVDARIASLTLGAAATA